MRCPAYDSFDFCRLRAKAAALSRPEEGLLVIISDLLSYNQVTTWRATLLSGAQCPPPGHKACSDDGEMLADDSFDDDGMAGLPDVEETLNVFLR